MIQRELARRDLIRDEIERLSADQQQAASQVEKVRQQQWEDSREAHRIKRQAGMLESPSLARHENVHGSEGQGAQSGGSVAEPLSEGRIESNASRASLKRFRWPRKISVSIPLRYLGRSSR